MIRWFSNRAQDSQSATKRRTSARRFRPLLEQLEDRRLLTVQLRLEQPGFPALTITDGDPLDQSPDPGVITFIGSYGTFNLNVITPISKPSIGGPDFAEMDWSSRFNTATGGDLTATIVDTDFTVPVPAANPLTFRTLVGGTLSAPGGGSVGFQGWANADNLSPLSGPTTVPPGSVTYGVLGPFTSSPYSQDVSTAFTRGAGPYSMFAQTHLVITGAGAAGFDYAVKMTGNPVTQPAALGDFVWEDKNANGVQDAGEPGIPGVTVKLLDSTGTNVLGTTTTDASGLYLFSGLTPGTYTVMFVPPSGYMVSPKDQGADDAKDSDADLSTGMTGQYTLASGETNLTADAGLFRKAALGDFVWEDKNANGVQDAGEPGIPGVTVKLLDATGTTVLATTTTDANGLYLFSGLTPGTYTVMFVAPSGYMVSPKDQGADDSKDSDADAATGMTGQYTLVSGQTDLTVDAGLFRKAALGDFVWHDLNANGVQDAGEPGIPGATVKLLDAAGNVLATTTTDASGLYSFTGLVPGQYKVMFVQPAGYDMPSPADQGGDDTKDSDAGAMLMTPVVTLASGDNNTTLDAGFFKKAALGDFVWEDLNANGVQDAGEPGIPGATVKLMDATGTTVLGTTTTDASGLYLFSGLTPGTYTVMFVPPSGYMVSPKDQGADDAKDSDADLSTGMTGTYTLASGQTNLTVDAGLFRKAALGDFVWEDKNVNGAQDAGEPGIPGVTVKLLDSTGATVLATTTTDASGLYLFTGLTPGTYKVMFVQPAGYTASPKDQGADDAKDSDADTANGMTGTYTLVSGQTNLTVDAGFYKLGVIKGTKYEDVTGNGLSADDVGLGGVVIYLDANNNSVKDAGERSTTTAADGTYQFTGLTPGTYIVREVVPAGYVRTYPALADYYSVVIASGTVSSGNNFANAEKCDLSKVTNVKFTVQHTDGTTVCVTDLRGNTDEGDVVTVTYTYTGTEAHDFTLVSYTAPQPYFDANTASQQRIFDLDTETVTAGTHTLTVHVPNCFFQIDFVCGLAIDQLGPAGSNIFYTPQMRLISADNDGTHACGSNPGTISGVKFHDLDADGVKDASEPGLGGWTIYLDANNNGVKDSGEVATVTGPDGSYKFNNLPAGTYRLREVMQTGWYQSKAPAAITLAAGQSVTDALFGNFKKGSISGYKFYDKNADGVWDKNGLDNCSGNSDDEVGLANWKIFLDLDGDGVLDGNEPYQVTDCNGYYSFSNLTPGTYQVREVMQPGWIRTTDNPTVALTSGQNVTNVLFGNFKGGLISAGDTATIGFWHNKNGQALLCSLNGGSSSKALGNWLASNFPKLYGSSAGSANNLTGKTNAQVASYFQTLFGVTGMKLEAQMLATAFAVYVTSSSLAGGSYAAAYGFNVTSGGVGGESYNVGSNGAAFGVVDGSLLTVMDILKRANDRAVSGVLYASDSTLRSMANAVFSGINQSGDITG